MYINVLCHYILCVGKCHPWNFSRTCKLNQTQLPEFIVYVCIPNCGLQRKWCRRYYLPNLRVSHYYVKLWGSSRHYYYQNLRSTRQLVKPLTLAHSCDHLMSPSVDIYWGRKINCNNHVGVITVYRKISKKI